MTTSVRLMRTWRQIAAEVGQEDDPVKLAQLTEELTRALQRELEARARETNTVRSKAA